MKPVGGVRMTLGDEAPRNWLIFDTRSECFWGPNRGGYFKSIVDAGLYTEQEARAAEAFARRYGRGEVARPLSDYREAIDRLVAALRSESTPAAPGNDRWVGTHIPRFAVPCCARDHNRDGNCDRHPHGRVETPEELSIRLRALADAACAEEPALRDGIREALACIADLRRSANQENR